MSRYIRDMVLQLPEDQVRTVINEFLQNGNFYQGTWKDKACYVGDYGFDSYGQSMIAGIYFFEYTYENGTLHFEAWVRDGKTKEIGLTGAYSFTTKQPYAARIAALENQFIQSLPPESPLRVQAETDSSAITGNARKMSKGMSVVYAISVLALLFALLNVLTHLGLF